MIDPMAELFTVVAWMQAKPGKEHDLHAALLALIEPTRKEDGCLKYDLHQHTESPGQFAFYENWTSKQHLDRHLASSHVQTFLTASNAMLSEPPKIETYWRIA